MSSWDDEDAVTEISLASYQRAPVVNPFAPTAAPPQVGPTATVEPSRALGGNAFTEAQALSRLNTTKSSTAPGAGSIAASLIPIPPFLPLRPPVRPVPARELIGTANLFDAFRAPIVNTTATAASRLAARSVPAIVCAHPVDAHSEKSKEQWRAPNENPFADTTPAALPADTGISEPRLLPRLPTAPELSQNSSLPRAQQILASASHDPPVPLQPQRIVSKVAELDMTMCKDEPLSRTSTPMDSLELATPVPDGEAELDISEDDERTLQAMVSTSPSRTPQSLVFLTASRAKAESKRISSSSAVDRRVLTDLGTSSAPTRKATARNSAPLTAAVSSTESRTKSPRAADAEKLIEPVLSLEWNKPQMTQVVHPWLSTIRGVLDGRVPFNCPSLQPVLRFFDQHCTGSAWSQLVAFLYGKGSEERVRQFREAQWLQRAKKSTEERWSTGRSGKAESLSVICFTCRIVINRHDVVDYVSAGNTADEFQGRHILAYALDQQWPLVHAVCHYWLMLHISQSWANFDFRTIADAAAKLKSSLDQYGYKVNFHPLFHHLASGNVRLVLRISEAVPPVSAGDGLADSDLLYRIDQPGCTTLSGTVIKASSVFPIAVPLCRLNDMIEASLQYDERDSTLTAPFQLLVAELTMPHPMISRSAHCARTKFPRRDYHSESSSKLFPRWFDSMQASANDPVRACNAASQQSFTTAYFVVLDDLCDTVAVGDQFEARVERVFVSDDGLFAYGLDHENYLSVISRVLGGDFDRSKPLFRVDRIEPLEHQPLMERPLPDHFDAFHQEQCQLLTTVSEGVIEHARAEVNRLQPQYYHQSVKPGIDGFVFLTEAYKGIDLTAVLATRAMVEGIFCDSFMPWRHSLAKLQLLLSLCSAIRTESDDGDESGDGDDQQPLQWNLHVLGLSGTQNCELYRLFMAATRLHPHGIVLPLVKEDAMKLGRVNPFLLTLANPEPIARKEVDTVTRLITGQEVKRIRRKKTGRTRISTAGDASNRLVWTVRGFKGGQLKSKNARAALARQPVLSAEELTAARLFDLIIVDRGVESTEEACAWQTMLLAKRNREPYAENTWVKKAPVTIAQLLPPLAVIDNIFCDTEKLMTWLSVARRLRPRLSNPARKLLLAYHLFAAGTTPDGGAASSPSSGSHWQASVVQDRSSPYAEIPATLRLNTLFRLAFAHARLHLHNEVSQTDAFMAVMMMEQNFATLASNIRYLEDAGGNSGHVTPQSISDRLATEIEANGDGCFALWPIVLPSATAAISLLKPTTDAWDRLVAAMRPMIQSAQFQSYVEHPHGRRKC